MLYYFQRGYKTPLGSKKLTLIISGGELQLVQRESARPSDLTVRHDGFGAEANILVARQDRLLYRISDGAKYRLSDRELATIDEWFITYFLTPGS